MTTTVVAAVVVVVVAGLVVGASSPILNTSNAAGSLVSNTPPLIPSTTTRTIPSSSPKISSQRTPIWFNTHSDRSINPSPVPSHVTCLTQRTNACLRQVTPPTRNKHRHTHEESQAKSSRLAKGKTNKKQSRDAINLNYFNQNIAQKVQDCPFILGWGEPKIAGQTIQDLQLTSLQQSRKNLVNHEEGCQVKCLNNNILI